MNANLTASNEQPTGGDVVTLVRPALYDKNHLPLGRTAFVLPGRVSTRQRLLLGVLSRDSRGIAARVCGMCVERGVRVAACFGARAMTSQGSYFEVAADDGHEAALVDLQTEFSKDDTTFEDLPPLPVDRFFEVGVRVLDREDTVSFRLEVLLHKMFSAVAEEKGNVTRFRGDGVDVALPSGVMAEVSAELELPKGVDVDALHRVLLDACPDEAEVAMRENRPMWDRRPGGPYQLVLAKRLEAAGS